LLLLLLLRAALLALPPLAPAGAARAQLRLREIHRQRAGDLLDRAQPLARRIDELGRAGGVSLGGREQRRTDRNRQFERRVDQLRRVLLVPVAAGVRQRTEQPLPLRELRARAPVLHLARGACEAPGPARQDLVRRVGLSFGDRSQENADTAHTVL